MQCLLSAQFHRKNLESLLQISAKAFRFQEAEDTILINYSSYREVSSKQQERRNRDSRGTVRVHIWEKIPNKYPKLKPSNSTLKT